MLNSFLVFTASLAFGAETFEGLSFYIGDPHVHTGASADGGSTDWGECEGTCGAIAELGTTARANGLDWISVTDHANGAMAEDELGYALVNATIMGIHDPDGGFVTLPGAELWFEDEAGQLGHKNLYLGGTNERLEDLVLDDVRPYGEDTRIEDCDAIWRWMAEIEDRLGPAMLIAHHPAGPGGMGTTWRCHEGDGAALYSPAVELYSRHGSSVECPADFDPLWMGCDDGRSVAVAMAPDDSARRLSFMAGTDAHDTMPGAVCSQETEMPHPYGGGLTVAVLDQDQDFDRASLFEAIQQGSTYATSGPLLPVVVDYSAGGERVGGMGDELPLAADQDLEFELRVPEEYADTVTTVVLVTPEDSWTLEPQGEGRYGLAVAAQDIPAWIYPRVEIDGERWYDALCDDNGDDHRELIWVSPSYPAVSAVDDTGPGADSEPGPEEGCGAGCAWGGAGPPVGMLLALLVLPALHRRAEPQRNTKDPS